MTYRISLTQKECFEMDPLLLAEALEKEMNFDIPDEVVGDARKAATHALSKATAFASYFTEMEMKARLMKKNAKSAKNTAEYNRLMAIEDVFKTYKEMAKLQIDNVTKLMTLKRLDLDEQKNNYNNNII